MKKLARIALIAAGIIGAAAVMLLLAVNMHVQSEHTHRRIERELSQRIGSTLRITRVSVTPWGGLKLSGITIPQSNGAPGGEFLEAKTFQLRIEFASLFEQRLVIKEIALLQPTVVWYQDAEGKWRLPGLAARPNASAQAEIRQAEQSPAAVNARTDSRDVSQPTAIATPGTAAHENRTFVPEIRRVKLLGAHFRFLDQHGRPVASFDDVQFRSAFRSGVELLGDLTIAKTSLRDHFFLQQLHSHVSYGPSGLEMSDIAAKAAGGDVSGHFALQPQAPDSPFSASVKLHGIDADRVLAEAGGASGTISGRIEGTLAAEGKTADPNALSGAGEIVLRDGQLRQYSLLDALGQLLEIEELRQLKLDEAQAKYHIAPGVVALDELVLHSPNLRLSAAGTIGFDGQVRLDSQLAISDTVRRQLLRPIRQNFQPGSEPGFSVVAFNISGTVERPKTNLMDKLVGRDLKDLGSMINAFMSGRSDRAQQRAADKPAAAAPQPSAPP